MVVKWRARLSERGEVDRFGASMKELATGRRNGRAAVANIKIAAVILRGIILTEA